jgi:hypothetical protein
MTEERKTEFILDRVEAKDATREMRIAKQCADHLHQHYPGHLWAVNVNHDGGTVNIFNLALSNLYGYVLHLTTVEHDPNLKCVMRAGGELLERAKLKAKFQGLMPDEVEGMPDRYQPGKRLKLN